MSSRREISAQVVGRAARDAAALGPGEVCALFRRSFYLRFPGGRYACVGESSLGRGPLNALVTVFALPAMGEQLLLSTIRAQLWTPTLFAAHKAPALRELEEAAADRVPDEGLGCLVAGRANELSRHARPALEALERWLAGEPLGGEAERLIGLGPGLTPSGDDYLGGMLIGLRLWALPAQAASLWEWLEPRIAGRTSEISAAHLAAAAAGEGHEALHEALRNLVAGSRRWDEILGALSAVGHCSGWDGLAGALSVARRIECAEPMRC
ncbi:MAG TPA: DUF2877 domain-containing protein [Burkholderiales bacterium]